MTVTATPRGAGAVEIVLDRPERANAMSADLVEDLHERLDQVGRREPASVILRATGRHYCGGFDLTDLAGQTDTTLLHRFERIAALLDRLCTAPYVTIALVHGAAVGAGADLALACDHRIALSSASLRFPGPEFGMVLGTRRLRQLAPHLASSLVTGDRRLDAEAAAAAGLFHSVHPSPDTAERRVTELARRAEDIPAPVRARLLAAARPGLDPEGDLDVLRSALAGPPGIHARLTGYVAAHQPNGGRDGQPRP